VARGVPGTSRSAGYSRWRDRSLHLCFKTVRATFAAHGSSVMCPLVEVSVWLSPTAQRTCDLTFRASPLRGIAPSRLHAGSSAFLALLLLITCTSPSSRQLILGITPGLGFLRNPSPSAMRLAPAPVVHTARRGQTGLLRSQVPWFASVGRCSPPGLSAVHTGQYRRLPAPYPVPFGSSASASCAGSRSRWLNAPSLALPVDACETGYPA
jgi:hypothetical protein